VELTESGGDYSSTAAFDEQRWRHGKRRTRATICTLPRYSLRYRTRKYEGRSHRGCSGISASKLPKRNGILSNSSTAPLSAFLTACPPAVPVHLPLRGLLEYCRPLDSLLGVDSLYMTLNPNPNLSLYLSL